MATLTFTQLLSSKWLLFISFLFTRALMHFGFGSRLMGKTFHIGLICQQAIHIMDQAINQFGTYEEFEEQTGGRILSRSQIISLVRKYLKKEDLESEIQVTLHIKM